MLADRFDVLLEDKKIPVRRYHLILSELGASENSVALRGIVFG